MPLEGSVGEFGLVDIFQLIAMQKKAGILTISCRGKENVSIFFLDGTVIRAASGDDNERFSDTMISAEKITIAQLRTALRITSKGSSIVDTFIKLNHITPEDARNCNKMLTQEILFDLLSWKAGSYQFNQESVFKMEYDNPMGVEWILMEGMRQSDEWPALLKAIPSRDIVYEKVGTYGEGFLESMEGVEGQPAAQASVMDFVNGVRTVNEIMNRAAIGAFQVYRELADLFAEGKIRVCQSQSEAKIEKGGRRTLSEISLGGIKEIVLGRVVLNGLIIGAVGVLAVFFFRPIFSGEKSIFQRIDGRIKTVRALSSSNDKDRIEFSLNLYYLKQNRYPDTLMQLKREGFLDQSIAINDWTYSHDSSKFIVKFTQK